MTSDDLTLCKHAAASYDIKPAGTVIDWRDCRMVISDNIAAIRGTVPDDWRNWLRDLQIDGELCKTHPLIGTCPKGPLIAAEELTKLLPPHIDTLTGHSLGGQIAVIMAGLLAADNGYTGTLVTWDSPKAGGEALRTLLKTWTIRQYRFRGSFVSNWPLFLDKHVREPLIAIEDWIPDFVKAHSITRAINWLQTHEST